MGLDAEGINWRVVSFSNSLLSLLELFQSTHRVLVRHEDESTHSLVSQSDLASYINKNFSAEYDAAAGGQTIGHLLESRPTHVIKVNETRNVSGQ